MKKFARLEMVPVTLCGLLVLVVAGFVGRAPQPAQAVDCLGDSLPARGLARLGTIRYRHPARITQVAFFPDGKTVAAYGGALRFWDVATGGSLPPRLDLFAGSRFALSPDGHFLACFPEQSTAAKRHIAISRLPSAEKVCEFEVPDAERMPLIFTPDGSALAIPWGKGSVHLVDPRSGRLRATFDCPGLTIRVMAFSADGKEFAAGCKDGQVCIWESSGKLLAQFASGDDVVEAVAFSPDGNIVATGGTTFTNACEALGAVRLWRDTGKRLRRIDLKAVTAVAFAPNGSLLAIGQKDGAVMLWSADGERHIRSLRSARGETEDLYNVAFSPDGRSLAAGGARALHVWDVETGRQIAGRPNEPDCLTRCLAPARDGSFLATCGESGTVRSPLASTEPRSMLGEGIIG